jgi:cytochrome c oxidase subunit 2
MKSKVIGFIACSIILSIVAELALLRVNAVRNIASAQSGDINHVLKVLVAIGMPIMVTVLVGLAFALIFFRQGENGAATTYQISSMPRLEAAWTFIPLVIVIGGSVFGSVMLEKMVKPNPGEMQIHVVASRYLFQFQYPTTGIKSFELVVPVGQEIHFSLTSLDVVHDFWVYEWGPKEDCIPGMVTELRITPTEIGNFTVVCSQLCGPEHTYMTAPVRVLSQSDYNAWVQQQLAATTPPPTTTMPGMGP